jgi:hypothetical protein
MESWHGNEIQDIAFCCVIVLKEDSFEFAGRASKKIGGKLGMLLIGPCPGVVNGEGVQCRTRNAGKDFLNICVLRAKLQCGKSGK